MNCKSRDESNEPNYDVISLIRFVVYRQESISWMAYSAEQVILLKSPRKY